jgi:hypothetical protein
MIQHKGLRRWRLHAWTLYCTVRTDHDMTRGRPCIVSILKDGSAQRKAVMTRTVPQSRECLLVSNLRSPLSIQSGLQGGACHLLHSIWWGLGRTYRCRALTRLTKKWGVDCGSNLVSAARPIEQAGLSNPSTASMPRPPYV